MKILGYVFLFLTFLTFLFSIGCGDEGASSETTSQPVNTSASEESGDCYFVEQDDGSTINLGPIEDTEATEEAGELSEKSTVYVNNCSGEIHVSGDTVINNYGPPDE